MFSGQVLGKDLGSSTLKIKIKYEKTFFNQKDYDIHNQLPFFCLQNENSKKVASFNLITTLDTNLGSSTLKMKIKCEIAFFKHKDYDIHNQLPFFVYKMKILRKWHFLT